MRMNSLAAAAAASLVAAPVAAALPVAAPLSLTAVRAGEGTGDATQLRGTTAWILAAVALGLIVWGIIELTGDDEAFPASP